MTLSGSPIFWILVLMAIAAVFIFFERLLELRRARVDWEDFVKGVINVLSNGNVDEALSICDDTAVPVANVVANAVRHREGHSEEIREAAESAARTEKSRLARRLTSLKIIGHLAPAVGLLGTIFGFIQVVRMVDREALVLRTDLLNCTMDALLVAAAGLMVAIPVTVMHGMLKTRLARLSVDIDAAMSSIVTYLSVNREKA